MRKYLALLAFGLFPVTAWAQSVGDGIEAWRRGDHAAAVHIWQPLAEKGDADAAFNVGQAYRLGKGVPLDLSTAQNWFERSARKGHVDAQATLGLLLFQSGNRVAAMRWLTSAADAGEPRAMLMVGTALYNGDGIAADPVKAYAYVSRAAAQGLAPAKATLADLDQVMPLEQRKQGIALAQKLAGGNAKSSVPVKTPPKTAAAKSAPAAAKPIPVAPKPAPAAQPAANGSWRVQLGAFSARASAEAQFAKVSAKLPGRQAYFVPAGKVIRLQAGPFENRAAATAACAKLSPTPCFPVEGR